ncbi:hypothetical protein [Methylotenera sp.]|uniref:RipA family octameric membrane protein n=1 Tax=Methylotenera sp. TaxID=2051956 RepID=UPI002488DB88|nr:hypothetical protein [Methylotenera sp.]MDI1361956.1 hypothetical protein [Methylotenera sp.]
MNEKEYKESFGLSEPKNKEKTEKALEHALDIRKFEIGLYWQRATYFWALIAVAFAGYFAILGSEHLNEKNYLAYIVGCIGLLFTWAWFLVNRGSKYWQENWENHVDMLEDDVIGPLYKTILHRPAESDFVENYITGPAAISASKTNQWVSLFTLFIWLALILHSLPEFNPIYTISVRHVVVALGTLTFACLMLYKGKTHKGSYHHVAEKRGTKINS